MTFLVYDEYFFQNWVFILVFIGRMIYNDIDWGSGHDSKREYCL